MSRAIDGIDRNAMLARLEEWNTSDSTDKALYNFTLHRILEQPTIEPQQRWIPCSEKFPEKDGDYLTTLTDKDGNYVDVTEWQNIFGGRWIAPLDECDYCEIGNVVAWMPLPEPYAEGRTDEV